MQVSGTISSNIIRNAPLLWKHTAIPPFLSIDELTIVFNVFCTKLFCCFHSLENTKVQSVPGLRQRVDFGLPLKLQITKYCWQLLFDFFAFCCHTQLTEGMYELRLTSNCLSVILQKACKILEYPKKFHLNSNLSLHLIFLRYAIMFKVDLMLLVVVLSLHYQKTRNEEWSMVNGGKMFPPSLQRSNKRRMFWDIGCESLPNDAIFE